MTLGGPSLAFVSLFGLASFFCFSTAFRECVRASRFFRVRERRVVDAKDGWVEIRGVAHAKFGTLRPPGTTEAALAYVVLVTAKHGNASTRYYLSDSVPFELNDDTGSIDVNGKSHSATFKNLGSASFTTLPEEIRERIAQVHGAAVSSSLDANSSFEVLTQHLAPGSEVYVLGRAHMRDGRRQISDAEISSWPGNYRLQRRIRLFIAAGYGAIGAALFSVAVYILKL